MRVRRIKRGCKSTGYVTMLSGRRRYLPGINSSNAQASGAEQAGGGRRQ